MTQYKAPIQDIRFALNDVLGAEALFQRLPGFESATPDIVDAVLEEAARFAEQVLAPLNASADQEGCTLDKATASVRTPKGFKEAYEKFVEGGWPALTIPAAFGGQELPETIGVIFKEMIDSANMSWSNFPMLSHGASEALKVHGEKWQQDAFLTPIIEGRWTGTMCLTCLLYTSPSPRD